MKNPRKVLTTILSIAFYGLLYIVVQKVGSGNGFPILALVLGIGGFLYAREKYKKNNAAVRGAVEGARRAGGGSNDLEGKITNGIIYGVLSFVLGIFVAPYQYAKMIVRLLPEQTVNNIQNRVNNISKQRDDSTNQFEMQPRQQNNSALDKYQSSDRVNESVPQQKTQFREPRNSQFTHEASSTRLTPQQEAHLQALRNRQANQQLQKTSNRPQQQQSNKTNQLTPQQEAHLQALRKRQANQQLQETSNRPQQQQNNRTSQLTPQQEAHLHALRNRQANRQSQSSKVGLDRRKTDEECIAEMEQMLRRDGYLDDEKR